MIETSRSKLRFLSGWIVILILPCLVGCSLLYKETPEDSRRKALDHFGKGERLEKQGEYLLAIDEYLKSERLSPRPAVYYHLGHCHFKLGKSARAVDYYEKALELAPDYRKARIELAMAKSGLKGEKKEVASAPPKPPAPRKPVVEEKKTAPTPAGKPKKAPLSMNPFPLPYQKTSTPSEKEETPPSVEEVRETLFPRLYGKEETAKEETENLTRYIDRKKKSMDNFAFHLDKARHYRKHKMYNTAILEYRDAMIADPSSLDAVTELADLYRVIGREERAGEIYSEVKDKFASSARFYLKWGNFFLSLNRLDEAGEKYDKALGLLPNYISALNNLGIVELRKENYSRAADYFQSVLDLDSTFASAHLNLGIVYSDHLKEKQKAREHFENYLKLGGPRSGEVREWLKAMNP